VAALARGAVDRAVSWSAARRSGALGLVALVAVLAVVLFAKSGDVSGVPPGHRLPPFAAPLASGSLQGDADIATRADDGDAGRVAACRERGAQIMNICELYEQGPVVLALFVDAGSCPRVLAKMQAVSAAFRGVRFAAVAIRAQAPAVRALTRTMHLAFPVALDRDGAVGALYDVYSCPQLDFAYRGGTVQSRPLLGEPSLATLRARVGELAEASARRQAGAARPA